MDISKKIEWLKNNYSWGELQDFTAIIEMLWDENISKKNTSLWYIWDVITDAMSEYDD